MRVLQFLLSHISTDLGDGQNPVNKPMSPFSKRVTAFLFEIAEESFTSGISERFTKRDEGGAFDEGGGWGGMEATMFWK